MSKPSLSLVTAKPPPRSVQKPAPPVELSKSSAQWWVEMRDGYGFVTPASLRTLTLAAESLDEMTAARKALTKAAKQRYKVGRNGALHGHPASRDYDAASRRYLHCLRLLKVEP
jgi:hypothetical protein